MVMEPVIVWAFGVAGCVFGLGAISALGSSRRKKKLLSYHRKVAVIREAARNSVAIQAEARQMIRATAMSAAAGSDSKEEDQIAQISGYPG